MKKVQFFCFKNPPVACQISIQSYKVYRVFALQQTWKQMDDNIKKNCARYFEWLSDVRFFRKKSVFVFVKFSKWKVMEEILDILFFIVINCNCIFFFKNRKTVTDTITLDKLHTRKPDVTNGSLPLYYRWRYHFLFFCEFSFKSTIVLH